ncbi:MAG: hypothetical protein Pg6A_00510 [Termitinemataceae bacterium]|nr:MAG: hypothetical protein Pg6A_00510 [Termitinemataceae bacterium]
MANRNKEEIAGIVRNTLIAKHGYHVEGDYVLKPISDNYSIGFYNDDAYRPLCICVCHKEGTSFSTRQRRVIFEVLAREEFQESYHEATEGDSSDGRAEIWSPLRIGAFNGWENQDIAAWIVKLFKHFTTTITLIREKTHVG